MLLRRIFSLLEFAAGQRARMHEEHPLGNLATHSLLYRNDDGMPKQKHGFDKQTGFVKSRVYVQRRDFVLCVKIRQPLVCKKKKKKKIAESDVSAAEYTFRQRRLNRTLDDR